MIFITGDKHGDFGRFSMKRFREQRQMSQSDHMIICGDFGGIWDNSPQEVWNLNWLENRPFTTLFVDGNHENFSMLAQYPVEEWHGGKIHRIRPSIIHLMRGQIYEIGGYSFFTMGGARSHDIEDGILDPLDPRFKFDLHWKIKRNERFRIKGVSWWPEELPSQEEYAEALETLERAGWEVDFVITHTAPSSVIKELNPMFETDELTDFLETIRQRLKFHYWTFGHYNKDLHIGKQFLLLNEEIIKIT